MLRVEPELDLFALSDPAGGVDPGHQLAAFRMRQVGRAGVLGQLLELPRGHALGGHVEIGVVLGTHRLEHADLRLEGRAAGELRDQRGVLEILRPETGYDAASPATGPGLEPAAKLVGDVNRADRQSDAVALDLAGE